MFNQYRFLRYFYENSIPQWLYFSEVIWPDVEKLFELNMANSNSTHLIISGWFMTSKFEDLTGKRHRFYLYPPTRMAVPQFRWKMNYDVIAKTGIIYVAMCNPYTPLDRIIVICEPIPCPNFNKLRAKTKKMVYCCDKKTFDQTYYFDPVTLEPFYDVDNYNW